MSSKTRHHYVPRGYLRRFRSAPRRIHVHNLASGRTFLNVSLRDQCYKRHFHGKSGELEDVLMEFESETLPTIEAIVTSQRLPARDTKDRAKLLSFVLLQALRSKREVDDHREMAVRMYEVLTSPGPQGQKRILEGDPSKLPNPVLLSLLQVRETLPVTIDLEALLLDASKCELRFVTSDNPAVRHNVYCEGVKGPGSRGFRQRGIMLFLPICPTLLVMFFDQTVYKLRTALRGQYSAVPIRRDDVLRLNSLQAVNAEHNLYFSDEKLIPHVNAVETWAQPLRTGERVRVGELFPPVIEEPGTFRSLVYATEAWPDFRLGLSLVEVKRRARKLPPDRRPFIPRNMSDAEMKSLEGDGHPVLREYVARERVKTKSEETKTERKRRRRRTRGK